MFNAALLTIAKMWKQLKCPFFDGWVDKNVMCVCVCVHMCITYACTLCLVTQSCPIFVTPQIVACKAPLSIEFSRQEYWSGFPCPPPGHLPNPGVKPRSPVLCADSLQSEPPGNSMHTDILKHNGILLSNKKEGNPAICNNINERWGHYAK